MEKLLAIVSLGQRAYGRWLFYRLIPSILLTAALTVTSAIMLSATLIGGLYASYSAMLQHGMLPPMAMMLTGIIAMLVIAVLIILTKAQLRRMFQIPRESMNQSPLASGGVRVLDAFISGLMDSKDKRN